MKTIQILLYLQALVWLVFGMFTWANYPENHWLLGLLVLNAILFAGFSYLIVKKNEWLFYFLIAFLIANIVLTLTDQVGVFDGIVLVLDFAVLNLVILYRKKLK